MRIRRRIARAAGALLVPLVLAGGMDFARAAESFAMDPRHSEIRFVWNHVGLSNQSAEFRDFEGKLLFDRDDVAKSTLEVAIRADSIDSGAEGLDERFLEPDMFDAAAHPTIAFTSREVKRIGARRGRVIGELTIKGITRPVTLDVDLRFDGEHPLAPYLDDYKGARYTAFSARGSILRSEFDMPFGLPLTSDEIQIVIETELRQVK